MTSSSRFIWNANGVSSITAGPGGQAANTSRCTLTMVGAVSPEPMTTMRLTGVPPRRVRPVGQCEQVGGHPVRLLGVQVVVGADVAGHHDVGQLLGCGRRPPRVVAVGRHGDREQCRNVDLPKSGRGSISHSDRRISRWCSRVSRGRARPSDLGEVRELTLDTFAAGSRRTSPGTDR